MDGRGRNRVTQIFIFPFSFFPFLKAPYNLFFV
jgi:hypothetical protein